MRLKREYFKDKEGSKNMESMKEKGEVRTMITTETGDFKL
jgi:hypothetical protein